MAINNLIFALQLNIKGFLDALRGASQGVDEFGDELEEIPDAADEATDSLDKSVLGMNAFAEAAQRVTEAGKSLFLAIQNSTEQYYSFNKAIAEVSTLVDSSITSNEQLSSSVQDLSQSFGKDAVGIAQGMYQAISAGAQAGTQANGLMSVALKTAVGGVTDVATAVDGLTTVVNAYGLGMSQADKVADGMFVTMKSGKTTIAELSSQYSQVIPIASALGISFDEVNAAVIGMTLQGTTTNVTMTQLKAALAALTKPSEELNAIFQKLGYVSNEAAIKQEGFAFALNAVYEASGGSVSKINALLGSTEATGVVLSLAGEKAHFMSDGMNLLSNKTGALNTAFDKVNANPFVQAEKAINSVKLAITRFGEQAVIALTPLTNAIKAVFDALNTFAKTSPVAFSIISQGITIVAGLTAGLGMLAAAIISTRFTMLLMSSAFTDVIASLGKMTAAIQAFSVLWGPLGIALAAAGAGYAAFSYLAQKSNEDLEQSSQQLKTTLGFLEQFRTGINQLKGSQIVDPAVMEQLEQVRAAVMVGRMTQEEGLNILDEYLAQVKTNAQTEETTLKALDAEKSKLADLEKHRLSELAQYRLKASEELAQLSQAEIATDYNNALKEVAEQLEIDIEMEKERGATVAEIAIIQKEAAQEILRIEQEKHDRSVALAEKLFNTKKATIEAEAQNSNAASQKIVAAEKELAQTRLNLARETYDAIRQRLAESVKEYNDYVDKIESLDQTIADEKLTTEDRLTKLRRRGMTEQEAQYSVTQQLIQRQTQLNEAMQAGDAEGAESYANSLLKLLKTTGDTQRSLEILRESANQALEAGNTEQAKQFADEIDKIGGKIGDMAQAEKFLQESSTLRVAALEQEKAATLEAQRITEDRIGQERAAANAQRHAIEENTQALQALMAGGESQLTISVQAEQAKAQIQELEDKLNALKNTTINVNMKTTESKAGGGVIGMAMGDVVPGIGNSDSVPALLTPGEYVVRKARSIRFRDLLNAINYGSEDMLSKLLPQFNLGGAVQQWIPAAAGMTGLKMTELNLPTFHLPTLRLESGGSVPAISQTTPTPVETIRIDFSMGNQQGSLLASPAAEARKFAAMLREMKRGS